MYGQSAVIYLSAAVFSACTIAGDSDVAVKQQEVACHRCSPSELQSHGAGSLMPRHGGRFGNVLLKHGLCTQGSDMYISTSLVIQYLAIKEKESKSCHGNVTYQRASALQYVLFNWIHWEISFEDVLLCLHLMPGNKKRPQQITSHYVIYKGNRKLDNKCVMKKKVV